MEKLIGFVNVIVEIKKKFRQVKTTKPPSSRKKSSEMYVVGLGYKHKVKK